MSWPVLSRAVVLAFCCIPTINPAAALEAAVRAAVRCTKGVSCGFDTSLSEAKKSAAKFASACQKNQARKAEAECLLPAATQSHICGEPVNFYYTWAYLEDVVEGKSALAELEAAVTNGKPYNGRMIVEASEAPADERHLALCDVSQVKGIAGGPPRGCVTVAIITPYLTLLRGGGRPSFGCFASASGRLDSGLIDIKYKVQTKLGIVKFRDSLQRMLSEDLGLTVDSDVVEKDGSISVIFLRSNAPLRESKILKGGWRESLAFDLNISNEGEYLEIRGAIAPMICRTASGNLVNYQVPDDAQRGVYARSLDSLVGVALTKVCSNYRTIDAGTIACQ
jgi:hypothetical protein